MTDTSKGKRDISVSIAKGIAIILMVMGHADGPGTRWLQMIRMPLFFFMSGYCFKDKYLDDATSYLKRRVTGIYLPYLKWSIAFLLLHNLFFPLHIYDTITPFNGAFQHPYGIKETLNHLLSIVTTMEGEDTIISPFWFLKSLFFGSIIFYLTRKFVPNVYIGACILLALAIVLRFWNIGIPYFNIRSKEFLAAFYIMFGHIYKTRKWSFESNMLFIVCSTILVGIIGWFWHTSMLHYKAVDIIPLCIVSISGTLVIFGISRIIAKYDNIIVSALLYVGNNTFKVLAMHGISFKVASLIIVLLFGLPIGRMAQIYAISDYSLKGWWAFYTLAGVGIPILVTIVYNKITAKING